MNIKNIQSWWLKWLMLGLIVRLILMPITVHSDFLGHSVVSYYFAYEGNLNIYDYLAGLSPEHPLIQSFGQKEFFIYPPLVYITLGIFKFLARPLLDPNYIPWLIENVGQPFVNPSFFLDSFLFKLPYLVIDIFAGFFLTQLFDEEKKKKITFVLWMMNPLTLYATFMVGQFDILPTFFTILSIYFVRKKNYNWAVISLGLGASYKFYPLLFVPVIAFLFGKTFLEKLRYILLGIIPLCITIIPFVGSGAFRQMVLFSPKNQKMLFMGWPVSGAEVIFPFILILFFIYFYIFYSKIKIHAAIYFLSILLLIFSVTHYHPQWFLWVAPFLIWVLVKYNFKYIFLVVTLFVSWFIILMFFEPSLSIGLFTPIAPNVADFRGFTDILSPFTDVFKLKSLIRSVFAGASLFLLVDLFKSYEH